MSARLNLKYESENQPVAEICASLIPIAGMSEVFLNGCSRIAAMCSGTSMDGTFFPCLAYPDSSSCAGSDLLGGSDSSA
jgi:hypothetical protein